MQGHDAHSSELVMWILNEASPGTSSLTNSYIFVSSLLIFSLSA